MWCELGHVTLNVLQTLGAFIGQLKEDKCDRLVQLNGLKVHRHVLDTHESVLDTH